MRCGWMVVLAACGRVGFDARNDGRDGDGGALDDDARAQLDDAVILGDSLPPSTCASQSVLVCDGFDEPAFDARWTQYGQLGTVAIDPTRAYRGASSFHAHTNSALSGEFPLASIRTRQGLMMNVTGTLYARVWAYFASPYPGAFSQILTFADQAGDGASHGARNGHSVSNWFASGAFIESVRTLPLDRWVCLQILIPSNQSGSIKLASDGVEITDAAQTVSGTMGPADNIYVGLDWPGTTPPSVPADAWFDEVIIDDAPIICGQ